MRKIYRQGDVLIVEVSEMPKIVKEVERDERGRFVLAEGEVTGHAHAISDPSAEMYTAEDVGTFLALREPTELVHEEHGKIDLPTGNYQVIRQREYVHGEYARGYDSVAVRLVSD